MSSSPVSIVSLDSLAPGLVRRLPELFRSYARYVSETALHRLAVSRAANLMNSSESFIVVAREKGVMAGLACWRRLDWDSELFGFPAARLELLLAEGDYRQRRAILSDLVKEVIKGCHANRIRHLVARIDAGDLSGLHALEQSSFEIVDGILTFSRRVPQERIPATTGPFTIRLFKKSDLDEVLAIARTAYVNDRFHADSALTSEIADRVNESWLRNSCLGGCDAVIIASEGNRVVAYVTCKLDSEISSILGVTFGTIGMVATRSDVRGRGVATCATIGALDWFREHGVSVVEVGTQLQNIVASRLYEKSGFRLTATHLTLRRIFN